LKQLTPELSHDGTEMKAKPEPQGTTPSASPALRSSEMLAAWHARLTKLAREKGVAWMICPDMETHREAFEDGLTPEEELQEQIDEARRSS